MTSLLYFGNIFGEIWPNKNKRDIFKIEIICSPFLIYFIHRRRAGIKTYLAKADGSAHKI